MPRRIFEVDGEQWEAEVSGRVTQYVKDEFGLIFTRGVGPERERRMVRYTPLGDKNREASLSQLSDQELRELLRHSQPSWTAPEMGYQP